MKKIAIYGAGGFGREVACLIKRINQVSPKWNLIGFFDDGKEIGYATEYGKVLGGMDELNAWDRPLDVVFAIGSPHIMEKLSNSVINPNIDFPNVIAPDLIYLDENNVTFGKGNIICSGCLLSCNVKIGDFNILNGFIPVGHDTTIGSYNSIMPSVKISGEVTIGNRNFFGVGSIVLQQIKIGNDTVIGANSLIIRKTKDGMTYVGSPATIIKL